MYIRIPYGCKVYTVRLLVCLFVRFFYSQSRMLFSPYGLHFLQHTVRDNIPLSPTRGGGCSPSASTPRPPTTACARTSDHSLTISNLPPLEISFSTSLTTVRDTFPILSFPLSNTPYGISNPTGRDFSLQYRTGFQQASLA